MTNNDLLLKVYWLSNAEYDKHYNLLRACHSEIVWQGGYPEDIGDPFVLYGNAFGLRTPVEGQPDKVWAGSKSGYRLVLPANLHEHGRLVGLKLKYDPQAGYVKSHEHTTLTDYGWSKPGCTTYQESGSWGYQSCEADIITFGGNKYLWTNRAEVLAGDEQLMDCISVNYLGTNMPIPAGSSYVQAKEEHQRCWQVVTKNCTMQERAAIVPVLISSKDNYQTAEPHVGKEMTN